MIPRLEEMNGIHPSISYCCHTTDRKRNDIRHEEATDVDEKEQVAKRRLFA